MGHFEGPSQVAKLYCKSDCKSDYESLNNQIGVTSLHGHLRRCEYDDATAEYWVNTRTEGSLKREDIERMERKRSHEQECDGDAPLPDMDFEVGGFPDGLGAPGPLDIEGDTRKSVAMFALKLMCK